MKKKEEYIWHVLQERDRQGSRVEGEVQAGSV